MINNRNHKDLVGAVSASMANRNEMRKGQVENNPVENNETDDELFMIHVPLITGRQFNVDARKIDWSQYDSPEAYAALKENEMIIRGMMHTLVTTDFSDPASDKIMDNYDESIMNFFANFGIEDPGYDVLEKNMISRYDIITNVKNDMFEACIDTNDTIPECDNDDEVFKIHEYISKTYHTKYEDYEIKMKRYNILLGKCFDALTLISVISHNVEMHLLTSKIFGITSALSNVSNLNDITEMDNSANGLISEDRAMFDGIDDHDVSGLVSE